MSETVEVSESLKDMIERGMKDWPEYKKKAYFGATIESLETLERDLDATTKIVLTNLSPLKIVAKIGVGAIAFPFITTVFILGFLYSLGDNLLEEL